MVANADLAKRIGRKLQGYRQRAGFESARAIAQRLAPHWGVYNCVAHSHVRTGIEGGKDIGALPFVIDLFEYERRISDYVAAVRLSRNESNAVLGLIRKIRPDFAFSENPPDSRYVFRRAVAIFNTETLIPKGYDRRQREELNGGLESALRKAMGREKGVLDRKIDYDAIRETEKSIPSDRNYSGSAARLMKAFTENNIHTYRDLTDYVQASGERDVAMKGIGPATKGCLYAHLHSIGIRLFGTSYTPNELPLEFAYTGEQRLLLDKPIDDVFEFSVRVSNCLKSAGIFRVRKLLETPRQALKALKLRITRPFKNSKLPKSQ
jgi:hypothetical protein